MSLSCLIPATTSRRSSPNVLARNPQADYLRWRVLHPCHAGYPAERHDPQQRGRALLHCAPGQVPLQQRARAQVCATLPAANVRVHGVHLTRVADASLRHGRVSAFLKSFRFVHGRSAYRCTRAFSKCGRLCAHSSTDAPMLNRTPFLPTGSPSCSRWR